MDFNVKIIEGVRQCPILYDNNCELAERSQAWLKLSDTLKTSEQVLKVRWHSLLQRYQQDPNFPYASKMSFLHDYISKLPVKTHQWPEFVITEEDLKDENPGEKVEFNYLIQEEQEDKNEGEDAKEKDCKTTEKEQIVNVNAKKKTDESSTNVESYNEGSMPLKFRTKVQNQKEKYDKEDHTNVTSKIDDMNLGNKESSTTELKSSQQNTNVESHVESPKENLEAHKEKTKSPTVERSEDDIFGELVTAMLKRMDESKKKNIKKEIINLLLS